MNLIERLGLGLMGILIVAFVTVLLLSPEAVVDFATRITDLHVIVRLLLVVALYAAVMGLAYLRIRRVSEPSINGLRMRSSGSVGTLSIESAEKQVLDAVQAVQAVKTASVRIQSIRGKAGLTLDVEVGRQVEKLPKKQREITRVLDKVVKRQLGVRYASRPVVRLRIQGDGTDMKPEGDRGTSTVPLSHKAGQDDGQKKSNVEPPAPKPAEAETGRAGRGLGGLFGGKRDQDETGTKAKDEDDTPTVIGKEKNTTGTDEFYAFLESTSGDSASAQSSPGVDRDLKKQQASDAAKNSDTSSDDDKFS